MGKRLVSQNAIPSKQAEKEKPTLPRERIGFKTKANNY